MIPTRISWPRLIAVAIGIALVMWFVGAWLGTLLGPIPGAITAGVGGLIVGRLTAWATSSWWNVPTYRGPRP